MNTTATAQDYQVGAAALAIVIAAAIKANVPEFLQSDVPAGLVQQIEQQGAGGRTLGEFLLREDPDTSIHRIHDQRLRLGRGERNRNLACR